MDESPRRWRLLFGHYLGDIILGANDGIITTFAVVAGVAGAQLPGSIVIILGIANLLADGISMGASNYLGSRSAQAVHNAECPVTTQRAKALGSGAATLLAFIAAGIVPLLSYLFPLTDALRFPVTIGLTGITLFSVGAARAVILPQPWWKAGASMFLVGALAAAVAYLTGWALRALVG
ncbi:MAG: VIT family protein [bacterium ADurb.Bin429]|nr:MAG: VIT family protein [bacterium ADurb.Bin429]